ncbi:MAG: serine/threonine protein kinase, partial [Deltaproteobacteria bacterium]|nr:serine/threonine protein kinase [Deltaproteobacteria bacterium]MBW2535366.1 serine/threonine protein kinase [Deltaproteobacteria bacterium]
MTRRTEARTISMLMEEERQQAQARVGTMLKGKWRLERLLGVGGMAAVYAATHRIGRQDAIKILHASVSRSRELRQRFEQEAHAVNRFSHPGAVEVRDIDVTDEGEPFLVMELLEGQSLSERVGPKAEIETGELLRYVDELLDVLVAAHAEGIIHRDIKPDNLFIQQDGSLKVLDFGIARMREGASKAQLTMVGARLGTVPYMPPEQVRGLPIDPRADLFAIGAMMFRLIAKRRVHEAPTEAEMVAKMTADPAVPLSFAAEHAPAEVCMVVDRALAFDPDRRYPDAATMQQDVQAARQGQEPPYAAAEIQRSGQPNEGMTREVISTLFAAPPASAEGRVVLGGAAAAAAAPGLGDAATAATSVGSASAQAAIGEMPTSAASPPPS